MTDSLDDELDIILSKSRDGALTSFLPDESSSLFSAFLPSQPSSLRSKAYVVLSAFCQKIRSTLSPSASKEQIDRATLSICKAFGPSVTSRISDVTHKEVLVGLSFLTALFEVDWQSASAIFQEDGVLDWIMDALDMFSSSPQIALAVAHLLAQASGHKSCRALLSPRHLQWLTAKSHQTNDTALRAAAAVALVKLSRGSTADAAEVVSSQGESATDDEGLMNLMKELVIDKHDSAPLADAVEGLAYLSTDPTVKEMLVNDSPFLSRLFSIIPHRKGGSSQSYDDITKSPLYGVVVITSNICSYRPRLTDEEAQIAKLRRVAKGPAGSGQRQEANILEDDDHVRQRGRKLVNCGVLDTLTAAVRSTESRAVRLTAGKTFLSLIEDKENRGKVLQAGGAKSLASIIQGFLPANSSSQPAKLPDLHASEIECIQALAKLAITASPVQVFGPNEGALYDAIRPFSLMLIHPSSNLLQRFEALMALTNLSSQSEEVASRIARAEGLLNKVELLMLEEHTLVRRAATELICNLVAGSEDVFNKYGGKKSSTSKSKLQVLLALCDVDDEPTQLAASGAVATLTSSPDACQSLVELQRERHRALSILGSLINPSICTPEEELLEVDSSPKPSPGLTHRGVVCIRNTFFGTRDTSARKELAAEADRTGLVQALVSVVKDCSGDGSSPVLRPTAEALKWLLENGIQVTV
ncbi:hypothetical protein AcV5_004991 [Taiwanofungus camphoratus]|nr:hypothetical protein AcW2_000414 [Antrodia cinnamomea]KAI0936980.1 hypothetical protein AcV5_004991 [Antrodia cinnamomea]